MHTEKDPTPVHSVSGEKIVCYCYINSVIIH